MISFGGSMWRYLKNSNSALIKKKPLSELISPMSLMGQSLPKLAVHATSAFPPHRGMSRTCQQQTHALQQTAFFIAAPMLPLPG